MEGLFKKNKKKNQTRNKTKEEKPANQANKQKITLKVIIMREYASEKIEYSWKIFFVCMYLLKWFWK